MTKEKDEKRKVPTIEAQDPSPIIAPHLERKPGEIPKFMDPEPEPAPEKEPQEPTKDELFNDAIARVIKQEEEEDWRELIKGTECFAKLWYDVDDDEICDQIDCDLRQLCKATWERVEGPVPEEKKEPTEEIRDWWEPEKKVKRGRPRKKGNKIVKRNIWKGTGKYERHPYQNLGRPVDRFAEEFHSLLAPLDLPEGWQYPSSKNAEQRAEAAKIFVDQFGSNFWVTRRTSYHQYIFRGQHLMRFWVNAAGGGWLDVNKQLAKVLAKKRGIDLVNSPASGYKTKFRFYPYRVYVGKDRQVEQIKDALSKIKDLVG